MGKNFFSFKKITTRAYLDSIGKIKNFAKQTDDKLCLYYSVNNFIQLSPFIVKKPLYELARFQNACMQYQPKEKCSGDEGFPWGVVRDILSNKEEIDNEIETLLLIRDSDTERLSKKHRVDLEIEQIILKTRSIRLSPENSFISEFIDKLQRDIYSLRMSNLRIFEDERWERIKSMYSSWENLEESAKSLQLSLSREDDDRRNLRYVYTELTKYPCLFVEKSYFDDFEKELFDPSRNNDPYFPSYGFILNVQEPELQRPPFTHAIILLRLYPFSLHGTQPFIVLDSEDRKIRQFSDPQSFLSFLKGRFILNEYYSIKGDLRMEGKRRSFLPLLEELCQKYQCIEPEPEGFPAVPAGVAAAGGGGGEDLVGGQTFYSFVHLS